MEDKLFYFPKTQNDVLWKDVKNSVESQNSEWSIKQDSSGTRIGSVTLQNLHKLYVTLIGGGGSGSLGEKRPVNSDQDYAVRNNSYTPYTNMIPLPGCGGGGAATIFRIPIILLQNKTTILNYTVGRGGDGMIDRSGGPIKTAEERLGKSGETTSIIISQYDSNIEIKKFKIKAIGGGGGGVVGYTKSREAIYNMKSSDVEYIWDWGFGAEHGIDGTEKTLEDLASYPTEDDVTSPDGLIGGLYIAAAVLSGIMTFGTGALVFGTLGGLLLADYYVETPNGKRARHQYWNIRHGDDPDESSYNSYTHFNYLAENWTAIFRRPSYGHVAFHRELEYPIGSDTPDESARNRNEYIPYNMLTHGEDGILRLDYLKPYDKIKLSLYDNSERYFGGRLAMSPADLAVIQVRHNNSNILPESAYVPSDSGLYKTINDISGVNTSRGFEHGEPTGDYYNFLWQYAPEEHYVDDRPWVQIWTYNVNRLRGHPRYYLRIGDTYLCKDKSSHMPNDSYLPAMYPMREKITIFAGGNEDIQLTRWSRQFKSLIQDYGGPIKKNPQTKGSTGAFGGAGGGFLHYDDPIPQTHHGLYGGKEMYNVWKIPESGKGGNPYPKNIWNTIDVKSLDASGLAGAYYYWGGEGYPDADSRGGSSFMTMHFIPGSGGGSLDYCHQNKRISRRKYTEQEVDFQDILPALSESPFTNIDDRVYKWYAEHYEELATGGKIKYRLRDASNNTLISRLYMNDLYGTHKINFTNRGETGPRTSEELLMFFGAGGGGGKAFYYTPGNGQENPDMEPNLPGYGCGSGGSCSLNIDGKAAIIGIPTGSVDWYLNTMIAGDQSKLYLDFHHDAQVRIAGAFSGVVLAIILVNILIAIFIKVVAPGIGDAIMGAAAAGLKALETGKAVSTGQKIAMTIMDIYTAIMDVVKQIKDMLKKIWQNFKAFIEMIFDGSTDFQKHLDIIKNIDDLADQAAEAAEALSKADQAVALAKLKQSGEMWKFHLKRIPQYFLSTLTGDIGDVLVDSFDDVVLEAADQVDGTIKQIGVVQNKIYKALFGQAGKGLKAWTKATQIGSKIVSGAVNFANAAEATMDIGRGVGNALENADVLVKNIDNVKAVDNVKAATNLLENTKNQQKISSVYDDLFKNVKNSLDNTDTSKFFDIPGYMKKSGLNPAEQADVLSKFDEAVLNGKFGNMYGNQTKALRGMSDDALKYGKNLDDQIEKAARLTNPPKVSDPDLIMKPRGDPDAIDDGFKTISEGQRKDLLEYVDKNISKVDASTKGNLEKFRNLLADQKQVLKYKHIPQSNTLQFLTTIDSSVIQTTRVTDPLGALQINDEITKIFDDFPGLKNVAQNSQPPVKSTVLKNIMGQGRDVSRYVNRHTEYLEEFVDMMKNGDFSKRAKDVNLTPIQQAMKADFDPNDLKSLLNKLNKNDNFKALIAVDPSKLEEFKALANLSDADFATIKLETFGAISRTNKEYIPNLLNRLTPDDIKQFRAVDAATSENFFKNVDEYLKANANSYFSGVKNGKLSVVIGDNDITGLLDEIYDVKKADLEVRIKDPNDLVLEDVVDEFDPTLKYNEKSLSPDNQQKLKELGFSESSTDEAFKLDENEQFNLFDEGTNNRLQEKIRKKQRALQAEIKAKLDSFKNGFVDRLRQQELIEPFERQIKKGNEVLDELMDINRTLPQHKKFVYQPPEVIGMNTNAQSFVDNGIDGVDQARLNGLVDKNNSVVNTKGVEDMKGKMNDELTKANDQLSTTKKQLEDAKRQNLLTEQKYKEDLKVYDENVLKSQSNQAELKDWETKQQQIKQLEETKAKRLGEKLEYEESIKAINARNNEIAEGFKSQTGMEIAKNPDGSIKTQRSPVGYGNSKQVKDVPVLKYGSDQSDTLVRGKEVILDQKNITDPRTQISFTEASKSSAKPVGQLTENGGRKQVRTLSEVTNQANRVVFEPLPAVKKFDDIEELDNQIATLNALKPQIPSGGTSVGTKPQLNLIDTKSIENSIEALENKQKFINGVQRELENIRTIGNFRGYSAVPPVAPGPIVNPVVIQDFTIPLNPVEFPKDLKPPVKIETPQNNYEYLFELLTDSKYRPDPPLKPRKMAPHPPKMDIIPRVKIPDEMKTISRVNMVEWVKINFPIVGLRMAYHVIYGLNKFFNTDDFTQFKPIKYRNTNNVEQEVNHNIMLNRNVSPTNFIQTCVKDILDKKPIYEEVRTAIYEDIFISLFQYPSKIEKSEIDNEMIAVLMEQRRRGIAIDVEYMKNFIDYDKLSIYNKLNYQYLSNDFIKVQGLLFNQINIVKKNHMVFV